MKKGKQPLVSVALATYNGERFLRDQLDSIFSQTYGNFEVIASDDNSSDGTAVILAEYKKKHRLKLIQNKTNAGFVKNFERALEHCSGDYIALADQDDIWHPDKLAVLVEEIGGSSIICSDAELIDGEGRIIAPSFEDFSRKYADTDDQFKFFVFRNYVTGCTSLITKDVIRKSLPIPGGIRYHDWWFAVVAATRKGVRYLPQPLMQYRQHGQNDTGAGRSITLFGKFREYRENRKKGVFEKEISNLRGMLSSSLFDEPQREVIRDRLAFYENMTDSIVHWKSFYIAVKYRNYMLAGRGPLYRLVFFIASLL